MWTIDLDGIDEAQEQLAQLRTLINLCWAGGRRDASPATLVVTCRSEPGVDAKEELISAWLGSPEPSLVTGVGFVEFGDFGAHELVDAARLLNGVPEQRIVRAAAKDAFVLTRDSPPVAGEILQSLRHPVVWGGYASLSEADRRGVLDGEQAGLDLLAEQLHKRFMRRCRVRRIWRDERMLKHSLSRVARTTAVSPPPYSPETWDQACQACLDHAEARALYFESLSYGIIDRVSGKSWRWGHPFLAAYLSGLNGGEANE